MMSGDMDDVDFDQAEEQDDSECYDQLKASGKKSARRGFLQMTLQAMPKKQTRSDNKDDVLEESLSDDITGTEIHGNNDKEVKLKSSCTVRK